MRENGVLVLGDDQRMLSVLLHALRGPIYSPKAARSRWKQSGKAILAFCWVAHRTVRCTTGQALFIVRCRLPSKNRTVDRCRNGAIGAPDSPVPPADRWRGHGHTRIARPTVGAVDRWLTGQSGASPDRPVNFSRTPLNDSRERRLHRRRLTGQSSAPPDSPVNYSRTPPSVPESSLFTGGWPGAPDTVRCTTGQSGVPDCAESWLFQPRYFLLLFSLIPALRQIG
jgi:hypothetical protein